MGEGALVLWPLVFLFVITATAAILAGAVIVGVAAWRRSKKMMFLGGFIMVAGCLGGVPPLFIWLDQFRNWRAPRWVMHYGWPIGIILAVLLFAAFVKAAWNERRWDLVDSSK